MSEEESIQKLVSTRKLLKTSLENSEVLASSLERTGSRLDKIHQKIPSLEAAVNPKRLKFSALADHLDHVIALAAAILRVLSSVHELENSILSPKQCSDISTYLSVTKRLEEALKFLSNSCGLAVKWLEGTLELFEDSDVPGRHCYVLTVQKCIKILRDLQTGEAGGHIPGELLGSASDRLEAGFKSVLGDETISETNVQKLKAVVEMLHADNRLKQCMSCYIEARSSKTRGCLQALGIDYLEGLITETEDAQEVQDHIEEWFKHLELAVNDFLEYEHSLCYQIFEIAGPNFASHCFGKIACRSGIIRLIQFGLSITNCKKDPKKLLKLLDMFGYLDSLRLQFNKLFAGEASSEIRALTRELIKRLVNGACDIFWELPYQVKVQRQAPPPPGGSVPWLLSFMTEYINQSLGSHYRPILRQVLEIHQSWKNEKYSEELLVGQVYNILKEIALNLDSWSKIYQDKALCYIFMMNNHSHFRRLKGTELGSVTGDKWLQAHEQYRDYYAAMYLRETFGRLQGLLGTSKGNSDDPLVIKKALGIFDEAIDQTIRKQSGWAVSDEVLRQKMCQLAVQTLVPAYRRCLQSYVELLGEGEGYESEIVSYKVVNLENKLRILFQTRVTKNGSTKQSLFWEVKSHENRQFQVPLTAT